MPHEQLPPPQRQRRRAAHCAALILTPTPGSFAGGSFRDRVRRGEAERITLNDQIVRQQNKDSQSHTAGFEVRLGGGRRWV